MASLNCQRCPEPVSVSDVLVQHPLARNFEVCWCNFQERFLTPSSSRRWEGGVRNRDGLDRAIEPFTPSRARASQVKGLVRSIPTQTPSGEDPKSSSIRASRFVIPEEAIPEGLNQRRWRALATADVTGVRYQRCSPPKRESGGVSRPAAQ